MDVIENGQGTPEASPALDADLAESSTAQAETQAEQGAEEGQEAEPQGEKQKPWYQRRIDEITAARRETERQNARLLALLEQQTQARQQPEQPQIQPPPGKPQLEQFQTYEDYTEALAEWKVGHLLQQREQQQREMQAAQQQAQREAEFSKRLQEAAAKTPEVMDAINDPTLPISTAMAGVIRAVPNGPDVVLHLSRNRDEAARLANLPPEIAAFELGRLAAGISPAQPRRTTPPPPAPINTLGGGTVATDGDPSRMTDAQFAAWRRQQIAQRQGR